MALIVPQLSRKLTLLEPNVALVEIPIQKPSLIPVHVNGIPITDITNSRVYLT